MLALRWFSRPLCLRTFPCARTALRRFSTTPFANAEMRLSDAEKLALANRAELSNIRNFCIIAHVDHGKSTLSDRLLELSGNITPRSKDDSQVLDSLQVERERGITIKAQSAALFFRHPRTRAEFLLNLIDTPGHVDFSYEVSRSMAACQGAVLLVDATQGVQAQTIANANAAREAQLDIIPVISKIDLPTADVDSVAQQMYRLVFCACLIACRETAFGVKRSDIITVSAKTGLNVAQLPLAVIDRVRPPSGDPAAPIARAMVFDSWFDQSRGVVCLVKLVDGSISTGDRVALFHANQFYTVRELGLLTPQPRPLNSLRCGECGYVIAGIKNSRDVRLGETMFGLGVSGDKHSQARTAAAVAAIRSTVEPLPGFKPAKSMVFAGIFAGSDSDFDALRSAIEKLTLNDASVHCQPESSLALGNGFRCGFLGVLHMQVFCERLEAEFNEKVILTSPTVPYEARMRDGSTITIEGPASFPEPHAVAAFLEPVVRCTIICPNACLPAILELCSTRRGTIVDTAHFSSTSVMVTAKLPLAEIVSNFHNQIKAISQGFASMDYEAAGYEEADLVKLEVKLNGNAVDALSIVCVREKSEEYARKVTAKLKELVDRQSFEIIIQCFLGKRSLARERIAPYRKDVLTKGGKTVGGGDVTRKMKLLQKQKEGKKRLKQVGNVELNDEVFTAVMRL